MVDVRIVKEMLESNSDYRPWPVVIILKSSERNTHYRDDILDVRGRHLVLVLGRIYYTEMTLAVTRPLM